MKLSCAHCLNRARWVLTRERLQRKKEPLYSNNDGFLCIQIYPCNNAGLSAESTGSWHRVILLWVMQASCTILFCSYLKLYGIIKL